MKARKLFAESRDTSRRSEHPMSPSKTAVAFRGEGEGLWRYEINSI